MMGKLSQFHDKSLEYYAGKLQRRIFRRVLEYQVLHDRLADDLLVRKEEVVELLGLDPELVSNIKIKDHIEKGCLTGIKAEFELFFSIYCSLVVDRILRLIEETGSIPKQHKGIIDLVDDKNKFFKNFMRSGFKDAKQFFLEQAIPSHGLDRLTQVLLKCGWPVIQTLEEIDKGDFSKDFDTLIHSPWKQIQVAFQVRHAIEHSFSRVGRSFVIKTKTIWNHSTWSRHFDDNGPRMRQRIKIDGVDIIGTATSITWVTKQLVHHWEEWERSNSY
jgi:hypothetical protein